MTLDHSNFWLHSRIEWEREIERENEFKTHHAKLLIGGRGYVKMTERVKWPALYSNTQIERYRFKISDCKIFFHRLFEISKDSEINQIHVPIALALAFLWFIQKFRVQIKNCNWTKTWKWENVKRRHIYHWKSHIQNETRSLYLSVIRCICNVFVCVYMFVHQDYLKTAFHSDTNFQIVFDESVAGHMAYANIFIGFSLLLLLSMKDLPSPHFQLFYTWIYCWIFRLISFS